MTKNEAAKLVEQLITVYHSIYRDFTPQRINTLVELWHDILGEFDYSIAKRALTELIAEDERGFPPPVGAVAARTRELTPKKEVLYEEREIDGEIYAVRREVLPDGSIVDA